MNRELIQTHDLGAGWEVEVFNDGSMRFSNGLVTIDLDNEQVEMLRTLF